MKLAEPSWTEMSEAEKHRFMGGAPGATNIATTTTLNFEGFSLAAALLIAFNRIRRASVFTARASLVALIFDDGPTGWSRMAEAMSAVRKVQGTIF